MLKGQLFHGWDRGKNEPMAGDFSDDKRTEGIKTPYFLNDVEVKVKEEIKQVIKCALKIPYYPCNHIH